MTSVTASVEATVERGVNETRMAAFAVIFTAVVGVGMTVGFASGPWLGLLAAAITVAATTLLLTAIYRVRPVRRRLMALMHGITGQ
jgi:multisubunit Na+/H+ antiporter MnhB subunit